MSVAVLADVEVPPLQQQPPVRVPKLAVRNRTVDGDDATARPLTATTVATSGSSENGGQTRSESPSLRAQSPALQRRQSDQSGSGSSAQTRRDGPSTAGKTAEPAKKKKSGMLGFLTMKEPSAMALEEFAEAQRKKAQEKGTSTVNVSGVSSRKLPDHVPKVNSKWDGLPMNAKKQMSDARSIRSRGDSTATSGRRPSTQLSTWTNRSDENKRPFGSLSSRPPQSPQLLQRSLGSRGTVSSTHSARAPIPNTNVHPAFRPIAVEETSENLPQTFLYPPSPPRQRGKAPPPRQISPRLSQPFVQELPASFGAVPELETSDGPLPELESSIIAAHELDALRSRDATPVPLSPITPPVDDAGAANYYSDSIVSAHSTGDQHNTFFHSQSDTDHEDLARPPKQLRQPINFSRRRARPPSLGKLPETGAATGFTFLAEERASIVLSPTLKNSEGRIEPFLTDTFAMHSRETGRIVERPPPGRQQQPTTTLSHTCNASVDSAPIRASTSTIQSPTSSTSAPTDASTRPSTADTTPRNEDSPDPDGPDEYYTTPHHLQHRASEDSLAPSLASSTMSARWTLSPKERLGLGSRIRKGEVLPWETGEGGGGGEGVRGGMLTSPPTTPTTTDGKFKRLSYRWSGRK